MTNDSTFRRLKRFRRIARSEGLAAGAKWLFVTLYRRIVPQKQVLWCTDLTRLSPGEFIRPDNMTIERLYSLDEIDEPTLKILTESNSQLMGSAGIIYIRNKFDKGAVLWLLKVGGQLAGYRWTIYNDCVTPPYLPHNKKDVHGIGAELFPAFRGTGLFGLFQQETKTLLKNEGYERFYSESWLHNKPAVKAHLKLGITKIGIAARFKIFGKNVVIWHDMTDRTNML